MDYHEDKVIASKPIKLKNRPHVEIKLNTEISTQQPQFRQPNKNLTLEQKVLLIYIHGKFFIFF